MFLISFNHRKNPEPRTSFSPRFVIKSKVISLPRKFQLKTFMYPRAATGCRQIGHLLFRTAFFTQFEHNTCPQPCRATKWRPFVRSFFVSWQTGHCIPPEAPADEVPVGPAVAANSLVDASPMLADDAVPSTLDDDPADEAGNKVLESPSLNGWHLISVTTGIGITSFCNSVLRFWESKSSLDQWLRQNFLIVLGRERLRKKYFDFLRTLM